MHHDWHRGFLGSAGLTHDFRHAALHVCYMTMGDGLHLVVYANKVIVPMFVVEHQVHDIVLMVSRHVNHVTTEFGRQTSGVNEYNVMIDGVAHVCLDVCVQQVECNATVLHEVAIRAF